MKRYLVWLFLGAAAFAQRTTTSITANNQCAQISVNLNSSSTVTIQVSGTWSATLQPQVAINGRAATNTSVAPKGSTTLQSTIAANGVFSGDAAGVELFQVCSTAYTSGTAVVDLTVTTGIATNLLGGGGGAGAVSSVFGRTGAVTATSGDYTAAQVTNAVAKNATNVYSSGLQDFTGVTMEIPEAAGFTTNVDSTIGLDTTGNCPHFWTNNADSFSVATTATSTTTTFGLFATAVPCIYTARAIAAGDIPSGTVTLDKVGGAAAAGTITESAALRPVTLAGVETAALTYPYVYANTNTTATSSGALIAYTSGAGGTAQVPMAVVENIAAGDFVDFYSLATVTNGVISGGSIKASIDNAGSLHVASAQGLQGLTSTTGVTVQAGIDGSAVNSTLTVRGADHTATAGTNETAGTLLLRGGNSNSTANVATVIAGPATLMPGRLSNASPGALAHEGVLDVDFAYKGAAGIGNLACPTSTAETIAAVCINTAANQTWIGIVSSTIGGSQAVQTVGDVSAVFDASITATPGDIVCTSTTVAGDVFDSVAVPCPNVQSYVGRVKYQVTASTAAAVVVLDHNPQVMGMQAKVAATAQTAAISTATLCTAAACAGNPGHYKVDWEFTGGGTACSSVTAGSVTFLLTWTDENVVTHSAVALQMMAQTGAATSAMGGTFPFQTALANEGASGTFSFSTNGTIIQYATGYTACTTGTGTYSIRAEVTRLQ